jgi:phosphatidylinositol glycan class U
VTPVCLRLKHDPLLAVLVLCGIIGTWKSYPTLGDTALWAGLLACFPEVTSSTYLLVRTDPPDLAHPLFTLTTHLYTLILLPLLHSLWLLTGTGNANFFYAATMVYGLNSGLAVSDVLNAGLRADVKRRFMGVDEGLGDDKWDKDRVVVQFASL